MKNLKSTDSRKPEVVAAFKRIFGGTKVTNCKIVDGDNGIYQADVLTASKSQRGIYARIGSDLRIATGTDGQYRAFGGPSLLVAVKTDEKPLVGGASCQTCGFSPCECAEYVGSVS